MTIILGIDPGSRLCGYGLISARGNKLDYLASGVIKMGASPFPERLHTIFTDISDIIEEFAPAAAAIEDVFMGKNASSALKLGQARGAAIVACTRYDLPVAEYSPRRVKQALVGKGQAEKKPGTANGKIIARTCQCAGRGCCRRLGHCNLSRHY